MKAFKLINVNGTKSAFQEGTIAEDVHIDANYFFAQRKIEKYQLSAHPAPRYQFVITLKGKLRFTVSDGSSFVLEPGIILVAKDLVGEGHSWEIIEGDVWHRLYIVPDLDAEDFFTSDV